MVNSWFRAFNRLKHFAGGESETDNCTEEKLRCDAIDGRSRDIFFNFNNAIPINNTKVVADTNKRRFNIRKSQQSESDTKALDNYTCHRKDGILVFQDDPDDTKSKGNICSDKRLEEEILDDRECTTRSIELSKWIAALEQYKHQINAVGNDSKICFGNGLNLNGGVPSIEEEDTISADACNLESESGKYGVVESSQFTSRECVKLREQWVQKGAGASFGASLLKSNALLLIIEAFCIHPPTNKEEKSALGKFLDSVIDFRSTSDSTKFKFELFTLLDELSQHPDVVRLSKRHIIDVVKRIVLSIKESPYEMTSMKNLKKRVKDSLQPISGENVKARYRYAADGISPVEEEIIESYTASEDMLYNIDEADKILFDRLNLEKSFMKQPASFSWFAMSSPAPMSNDDFLSCWRNSGDETATSSENVSESSTPRHTCNNYRQAAKETLSTLKLALGEDISALQTRLKCEQSHMEDIRKYRKKKQESMKETEVQNMELVSKLVGEKADIEKQLEDVKGRLKAARQKEATIVEEQRRFIEANDALVRDLGKKCELTTLDIQQHKQEEVVIACLVNLMDAGEWIVRDIAQRGSVQLMELREIVLNNHIESIKRLVVSQTEEMKLFIEQLELCSSEINKYEGRRIQTDQSEVLKLDLEDNDCDALVIKYKEIESNIFQKYLEITKLRGRADNLGDKWRIQQQQTMSSDFVFSSLITVFEKGEQQYKLFQQKCRPAAVRQKEEYRKVEKHSTPSIEHQEYENFEKQLENDEVDLHVDVEL